MELEQFVIRQAAAMFCLQCRIEALQQMVALIAERTGHNAPDSLHGLIVDSARRRVEARLAEMTEEEDLEMREAIRVVMDEQLPV